LTRLACVPTPGPTTQCIQPGGDKSRILTVAIGGQTTMEREAANR